MPFFSHFAELLLKHYVASQHPLLVYRDPFARDFRNRKTIGLWEAVNFIRNQRKPLSAQFIADLEWIKSLRNQIEHHRFEMEILQVRLTMGRLSHSTESFAQEYCGLRIWEKLGWERFRHFIALKEDYEQKLIDAKAEERRLAGEQETLNSCGFCGNSGTVYSLDEEERFRCTYCGEEDLVVACVSCLEGVRLSEARDWNSSKDEWM